MAGESQHEPATGSPDPSVLTTEQMLLAIANEEKRAEAVRAGDNALANEKIARRAEIDGIREEHRKELKADSEKALSTAREADQKAVAAALAAAEKARDQQTVASQLATDKAEVRLLEALSQQQTTFSVAISNVQEGVSEVKTLIGEIRAERRGGLEARAAVYAFAGFIAALVLIGGFVAAVWPR